MGINALDSTKAKSPLLLGIEYDESMGIHIGAGPYVLVAHKPQAIKEVYESISKGS